MNCAGLIDIDDMEVVENMGLDPAVAYTPRINKAALDKTLSELPANLASQGIDKKSIDTYVKQTRSEVMEQIKKAEDICGMKLI